MSRPPADRSSPEPGCSTSDCTSPDSSTGGCASPILGDASCCEPGSECRCMTTSAPCEVRLLPTPEASDATGGRVSKEKGGYRPSGAKRAITLATAIQHQPLTSSPAASPARARPAPATAQGSNTPRPLCGVRCGASLASFDPAMCSSRTSRTSLGWRRPQASLLDPSGEPFSGTWPRSGSMCDGTVFPLRPSAPRTSVTGCSPLLGTPMARDGRADGNQNVPSAAGRGTSLMKDLLPLLPTPKGHTAKDTGAPSEFERKSPELTAFTIARLLPTPVAGDGREKGGGGRWSPTSAPLEQTIKDDLSLSNGARTSPPSNDGKPSTGVRLNPSFVGWMMGTPSCRECGREWTDPGCPHSVTAYTSTADGLPGSM